MVLLLFAAGLLKLAICISLYIIVVDTLTFMHILWRYVEGQIVISFKLSSEVFFKVCNYGGGNIINIVYEIRDPQSWE